jgi:hypothetical protein
MDLAEAVLSQRFPGPVRIELTADVLQQLHATSRIVEGQKECYVDIERTARLGPEAKCDCPP